MAITNRMSYAKPMFVTLQGKRPDWARSVVLRMISSMLGQVEE